nr:glutamine amidotransferase family protein [Oryzibacter oryziterrae]
MCGIVGLFLKDPALEPELGKYLSSMLKVMTDRGPDSAGFAVYGRGTDGLAKVTVRLAGADAQATLLDGLGARFGGALGVTKRSSHLVLTVPEASVADLTAAIAEIAPAARIASVGANMEVYKEVGLPADVSAAFGLETMAGTHAIGHTRMATESAVTTDGAHPFSTGPDQCLVHNGSLSNHNNLRRELRHAGMSFATENDSEVAAVYLTAEMAKGKNLGEALEGAIGDLDGFFTFVVGTRTGFGVLRDPIACKPAVMAETDQYVAFGSEYRALVDLPGIETARVWEPEPATVYFWEH